MTILIAVDGRPDVLFEDVPEDVLIAMLRAAVSVLLGSKSMKIR